jgi:hypothetical protein
MKTIDRSQGMTEADARKALAKLDAADRNRIMGYVETLQKVGIAEGKAMATLAAIGAYYVSNNIDLNA